MEPGIWEMDIKELLPDWNKASEHTLKKFADVMDPISNEQFEEELARGEWIRISYNLEPIDISTYSFCYIKE